MDIKLILELNNHNIYYVKSNDVIFYITIPKNVSETSICIELKSKMHNYNLELNDEVWVMENVKNTFEFIDSYNITLVLPILSDTDISNLEKIDTSKYESIDKTMGQVINLAYNILKEKDIIINNQVVLINNDRYKTFINWFTTRYKSRVICKSLLELIQLFNVNATSYKKLETPVMSFVVGSYNTEIEAPKSIPKEEVEIPIQKKPMPQVSSGYTTYWLLAVVTLVVAGVVAIIAFTFK